MFDVVCLLLRVIHKAYDYATSFAKIKVRQAVLDLRSVLDKHGDLVEFEIASLVNIFPRSINEAKVCRHVLSIVTEFAYV